MRAAQRKHITTKKVTTEKEPEVVTADVVAPEEVQPSSIVERAQTPGSFQPSPVESPVPEGVLATEQKPSLDPLTDFKEKMSQEEHNSSFAPAGKNYMWPILFVVLLALALLGGIFLYKQGVKQGEKVNVITLSPTPTLMPEPTKTIDLTKYEIEILNGSEIDGEASRQKESLEKGGFVVSSVGNAAKSDYAETIIQAKTTVDYDFLDKLKSVLETSFKMGDNEELADDASSDVIVIIGSGKK